MPGVHDWMVRELLRNLLGNAIHYSPLQGALGIAVDGEIDPPELVVWDAGPGISDEQFCQLFQPFSTGDPVHGSGLGLLICRDICRAMDAQLTLSNRTQSSWFDPRPKELPGLVATVRLPRAASAAKEPLQIET